MDGEGSSPPFRQSPYSPFPFGSSLGMSDRSVANSSTARPRSSLNIGTSTPALASTSTMSTTLSNSLLKGGRVRVREAYGGPVMFGGNGSSNRKSRLFAASPYAAAAMTSRKPHQRPIFDESTSRRGSSAAATPSPAPSPSPSSTTSESGVMSSTARLIFDTLEKMSTPIRDAQKLIPSINCSPPRAEKRRAIAEQLDWSHGSLKRRRPQLGSNIAPETSGQLNGPPLRTIFSPVSASQRLRSTATKSARISSGANNSIETGLSRPSNNMMPSASKTSQMSSTSSMTKQNISPAVKKTLDSSPSIGLWSSPVKSPNVSTQPFQMSDNLNSTGGKIKPKLGDSKHFSRSNFDQEPDPLPAFLASHNNALPIKTMPTFKFNQNSPQSLSQETIKMSQESLASTVQYPGLTRQSTSIESFTSVTSAPDQTTSTSFSFSMPCAVVSKLSIEASEAKNVTFSFCQPEGVAKVSSMSADLTMANNSLRNSTTLINTNHRALPDLTATMRSPMGGNNVLSAPKSLKSGSVMDILGRNHMLPDVTSTTTSLKAAPELKNDSVMSILGSSRK